MLKGTKHSYKVVVNHDIFEVLSFSSSYFAFHINLFNKKELRKINSQIAPPYVLFIMINLRQKKKHKCSFGNISGTWRTNLKYGGPS